MFRSLPGRLDFEFETAMPDEVTISAVALPGRRGAFDVSLRGGRVAAIRPVKPAG